MTTPSTHPGPSQVEEIDFLTTENLFKVRMINLALVIIPFAGVVVAVVLLWGIAFSLVHLIILAGMYVATVLGITIGYHRFFSHRSFKTSSPIAVLLAVLGSMAVQGPVLNWVADHRKHHQHSDKEHDPHSPHLHGSGFWSALKGMIHSHLGWLFQPTPKDRNRYIVDFKNDRVARAMHRLFPLWVIIGLLLPALLGGLFTMSWTGALLGFLWGGLVRIFLVHHVTWSVNSVCHLWGQKPFNAHDESRNNVIFGVLAMGEGWHNNHHAFPTSARHGLRWWQLDVSYIIIWCMSKVGLAHDLRIPHKDRMLAKRAH